MTREQIIVVGVIAAAFVAGWIVHALTGRTEREIPVAEGAPTPELQLEQAVELSRLELDRAARTYAASLLLSESGMPGATAPSTDGLTGDVSSALRDDAANDCMLSLVRADHDAALTDRELDLTDWGFAYGVAWARAREQDPSLPEAAIAREALHAAETVFRDYTGGAAEWPAGEANGHRASKG